jgi:hypothetical protein
MAKPRPPSLPDSRTFSFKMPFPRLGRWSAGKLPAEDDLTTTKYGMRYLELARLNSKEIPVSHRAFWLDPEWLNPGERERISPFINAIERFDKLGDKGPLLTLMRSQGDPLLLYLADLFDRYKLTKPAHRSRTPAYDRTPAHSRLLLAEERVRNYRRRMPLKDALAMAARDLSVEESALAHFHAKRHRASKKP